LPDNRLGGALVGEHVRALGHRCVGVVAGPEGLASAVDRLKGVLSVLDGSGVTVTVEHSAFTHEGGRGAATALLRKEPRITALIALNDSMAAGIITAAREHGLALPADLTVTGFDDVAVAADLGPG